MEKIFHRIEEDRGAPSDLLLVKDVCSQIAGHTICPFGDALVTPALSFIEQFPEEFERKLDQGMASRGPLPIVTDIFLEQEVAHEESV